MANMPQYNQPGKPPHYPPPNQDDPPCPETDTLTQKSINRERTTVCNTMYDSYGSLSQSEKRYDSEQDLYHKKTCLFNYTEENYRRYRNLFITTGTEIVQSNDAIKNNVAKYIKWNKDLNAGLRTIAKTIKDVKTRFGDLAKAACDLERCVNDSCNAAQRRALTGKSSEECKDDTTRPDDCAGAEDDINKLICMPKALTTDIDSLFKSAFDVVGIQVFSNIETLDPLQKNLDDKARTFSKMVGDIVKLREDDLKKLQDDLIKSVQSLTTAAMDRNNARSDFEGYYEAVDFLCCPDCECLEGKDEDWLCDPRLDDCKQEICAICKDVQNTFCCNPQPTTPGDTSTAD